MGYESSAERWSPVQSVEKILLSVVSMLAGTLLLLLPASSAAATSSGDKVSGLGWYGDSELDLTSSSEKLKNDVTRPHPQLCSQQL